MTFVKLQIISVRLFAFYTQLHIAELLIFKDVRLTEKTHKKPRPKYFPFLVFVYMTHTHTHPRAHIYIYIYIYIYISGNEGVQKLVKESSIHQNF